MLVSAGSGPVFHSKRATVPILRALPRPYHEDGEGRIAQSARNFRLAHIKRDDLPVPFQQR
jgi:hypothetical protein